MGDTGPYRVERKLHGGLACWQMTGPDCSIRLWPDHLESLARDLAHERNAAYASGRASRDAEVAALVSRVMEYAAKLLKSSAERDNLKATVESLREAAVDVLRAMYGRGCESEVCNQAWLKMSCAYHQSRAALSSTPTPAPTCNGCAMHENCEGAGVEPGPCADWKAPPTPPPAPTTATVKRSCDTCRKHTGHHQDCLDCTRLPYPYYEPVKPSR